MIFYFLCRLQAKSFKERPPVSAFSVSAYALRYSLSLRMQFRALNAPDFCNLPESLVINNLLISR